MNKVSKDAQRCLTYGVDESAAALRHFLSRLSWMDHKSPALPAMREEVERMLAYLDGEARDRLDFVAKQGR